MITLAVSTGIMDSIMGFFSDFGIWIVLIVGMVLMMWLPQRKQKKQFKDMMSSLKAGDNIRTIGGFYGKIVQIKEDRIVFECGPDKSKLTISKNAISAVENVDTENSIETKIESK